MIEESKENGSKRKDGKGTIESGVVRDRSENIKQRERNQAGRGRERETEQRQRVGTEGA